MKTYLTTFKSFWVLSLQNAMEYRFDFFMNIVNAIVSFAVSLAVLWLMFINTADLSGWKLADFVLLIGVLRFLKWFQAFLLSPNLGEIPHLVKSGGLDFVLLKPLNGQFYLSLRNINFWTFPDLLIALSVAGYGLFLGGVSDFGKISCFGAFLLLSCLILYSVMLILMTTSIWLVDVGNLPNLLNIVLEFGQYPTRIFPVWLRFAFTFVLPITLMMTVPVEFVTGKASLSSLAVSGACTVGLFIAASLFWGFASRRYCSPGG